MQAEVWQGRVIVLCMYSIFTSFHAYQEALVTCLCQVRLDSPIPQTNGAFLSSRHPDGHASIVTACWLDCFPALQQMLFACSWPFVSPYQLGETKPEAQGLSLGQALP